MNENPITQDNSNPVNPVNPVETIPVPSGGAEDTSPLCPPCSDVKGRRPKTGRPLSRMECLSDRQLMHINAWLDDGEPFKKLVDLCKSNFDVEIPKTTFQRYYRRSAARTLIADLADSKEAAAEISKYAVTGVALFSTTTLEILEQQAFDLAVAFQRDADAEDLGNLKDLWTLIHKAKNTNIRERHAAVQEQKIQLRREELALKRELALKKTNTIPSSAHALHDATPSTSAPNQNCWGEAPAEPTSTSRDAMTKHNAARADLTTTHAETPSASSDLSTLNSQPSTEPKAPFEHRPGPCPLPLEVIIENRRYAEKLLAGLVDPDTGEELPDPNEVSTSNSPLPLCSPVQNPASSTEAATSNQNGGAL